MEQTRLQYAGWLGNTTGLIMVYNNDIYVRKSAIEEEIRITDTGYQNVIYNGVPDWLYQGIFFPNNIFKKILYC